jgi:hypothetical protein
MEQQLGHARANSVFYCPLRFFTLQLLREASQRVRVPLESAGYAVRMRQAWIRVGDYEAFPASQRSNFSRLCCAGVPRQRRKGVVIVSAERWTVTCKPVAQATVGALHTAATTSIDKSRHVLNALTRLSSLPCFSLHVEISTARFDRLVRWFHAGISLTAQTKADTSAQVGSSIAICPRRSPNHTTSPATRRPHDTRDSLTHHAFRTIIQRN